MAGFYQWRNDEKVRTLLLHITAECNLSCIYCYAKNVKINTPNIGELKTIISDAKDLGLHEIQFVGGEPLLHPQLYELMDYVMDKGMRLTIYTNGTLIDSKFLSYLTKYRKRVFPAIKFDSTAGFKAHLGKDLRIDILDKISHLRKAKITVYTFIVATKLNLYDIDSLLGLSLDLGCIPILERYLPTNSPKINSMLELNALEWGYVLSVYDKRMKRKRFLLEITKRYLGYNCACYKTSACIDLEGNLIPCPYSPAELSVGNIRDYSLAELLKIYADKRVEWNMLPKECSECNKKHSCQGGCKTYTYLKENSHGKRDSYCMNNEPNKTMRAFSLRHMK